jgi:hypothetical protein
MKQACDDEHFQLNTADGKCQMLVPTSHAFVDNQHLSARQLVKTEVLAALGSAISFNPGRRILTEWLNKEIVLKNKEFFERLSTASIPLQAALNILSTCGVLAPPIAFAPSRSSPPAGRPIDAIVDSCLERLLDIQISNLAASSVARQQLSLPLNHAGVGAKRSAPLVTSAALASRCLALPDIIKACEQMALPLPDLDGFFADHMDATLPNFYNEFRQLHRDLWSRHKDYELISFFPAKDLQGFTVFPEDEGSLWHSFRVLDDVPPRLQAIFYSARASADMKELCQGLSPVDLARLTSAKHRLSGLAFRADIPDPRCQMSDQDFRLAIRFRLGLHLSREAARGTCPFCKDKVSLADEPGHPIDCIAFRAEHQRARHNRLVNLIASIARQDAGCDVQTEIRLAAGKHDTRLRPDLFVVTYEGRSFWSDVQVTRPDSVTNRKGAASKQCHAADTAAQAKVYKYARQVAARGGNLEILPLCFETFGAPSASAVQVFEPLLSKSAEAGGSSSSCFGSFQHLLETAVSVCLQRGNALVISSYLKALALRRHNSYLDASGSLLVANHASR